MANLTQQAYNAAVYDLIDAMLTANPTGVQKELQNHGFDFKFGQNSQLAELYLNKTFHNNPDLFWQILNNVRVDKANVPPDQRERLSALFTSNSTTEKGFGDWFKRIVGNLQGSTTTSTGGETITQTATGAYIAYAFIVLAIIGITWYLLKSK